MLVSASNTRLVRTIVDEIELALKIEADDERPRSVEGLDDATWVLIDYGDVDRARLPRRDRATYYDLDRLWADAPAWSSGSRGAARAERGPLQSRRSASEVGAHRDTAARARPSLSSRTPTLRSRRGE